jgi:2-methylisocitrate lyase-like PEP mutase family enzyme
LDPNLLRERALRFTALHQPSQPLLLPNVWDATSALLFAQLGFPALATTSAGIAFSRGYPDGERISRDEMLEVVRSIAAVVDVPLSADLEAGYGRTPESVAETVRRAIAAGAVGTNIEDGTKDPQGHEPALLPFELAVERIRAAREVADAAALTFVINARTDAFLRLGDDNATLAEAVRRGNAFAEAGARSVFVPGVTLATTIGILARDIRAPLNVLAAAGTPPLPELAALGVARVTFGSGFARAAYAEAVRLAAQVAQGGLPDLGHVALTGRALNEMLLARRGAR